MSQVSDSDSEDNSVATEKNQNERQEQFKNTVRQWVMLDNEILELRKEINARNKQKKKLAEFIVNHMKTTSKEFCNLGSGGLLELKQRKTSVTLKKDYVEQLLSNYLNDNEKAKESAEYIFQNKQTKFTDFLKRSTKSLDTD